MGRSPMQRPLSLYLLLPVVRVHGDMYDIILPNYAAPTICPLGCADWSNVSENATIQSQVNALWAAGKPPTNSSNLCGIPAAASNAAECHNVVVCNSSNSSFYGPICVCKQPTGVKTEDDLVYGTCFAKQHVPEQVNVQIAAPDVLVVSFVTFDEIFPSDPPVAIFAPNPGEISLANGQLVQGIAHRYTTSHANNSLACHGSTSYLPGGSLPGGARCAHRNYTLNFVRLAKLAPGQNYSYKVRSGDPDAVWSEVFTLRTIPGAGADVGPTRLAIYGDMGVCLHNNMANLLADCKSGRVDAIAHLGDHCYDLGMGDDLHGDVYMNAFQPVLSGCAWIPVIGNHESTKGGGADREDASTQQRYLNQSWGIAAADAAFGGAAGSATPRPTLDLSSTATTGLGHMLTRGTFYAAGLHGGVHLSPSPSLRHRAAGALRRVPSLTSQWTSVDIGRIHFVALDLDPGPPAAFRLGGEQAEWLKRDLAAADANRGRVPWIVVSSHFPLHSARLDAEFEAGRGVDAEKEERSRHSNSGSSSNSGSHTSTGGSGSSRASLEWYMSDAGEAERNGESGVRWGDLDHFSACSSSSGSGSSEGGHEGGLGNRRGGNGSSGHHRGRECVTAEAATQAMASALDPILDAFAVDLYAAGHVHSYSVSWPLRGGAVVPGGDHGGRSYDDPNGTVHILEGNGGVPSQRGGMGGVPGPPANRVGECLGMAPMNSSYRVCGTGGAYGRLVAHNATVLEYEHVENPTGSVTDRFAIRKSKPGRGW